MLGSGLADPASISQSRKLLERSRLDLRSAREWLKFLIWGKRKFAPSILTGFPIPLGTVDLAAVKFTNTCLWGNLRRDVFSPPLLQFERKQLFPFQSDVGFLSQSHRLLCRSTRVTPYRIIAIEIELEKHAIRTLRLSLKTVKIRY